MYDIIIIGAGITGTMIARELSRFKLNVAVLEKDNDVGNETTSANSAIIHSGYDPLPGTLKAKFNVLGNKLYDQIAKDLDVPFDRIGSLTLAMEDEQLKTLEELKVRAAQNGVEVKLLNKEETKAIEPIVSDDVKGSLLAPTAGIIDPFQLCVHAMENAMDNGVKLFLSTKVLGIKKVGDYYEIETNKEKFKSKIVINAAGTYADRIAEMVEEIDWKIIPRKGEYYVLDHFVDSYTKHTIFPLPSAKGKGVLVSISYSHDVLVGPSSEEIDDRDDVSTDLPTLMDVRRQASLMVPNIPFNKVIREFAGLRPTCTRHDFVIEYSKKDKNFINVGGIESPGLASSPAIAQYVVNELVKPIITLEENKSFNPKVRPYHRFKDCLLANDAEFIKNNPEYGQLICNCERVSLGEIKDILSRNCAPHSVKGMKRRTRAGYGQCQGGFCQPKVVAILAKHYGVSPLDIPLNDEGSNILLEKVKEVK